MSDDVHSFQVIMEKDISDDEAAAIAAALRLLRGVVAVQPISSSYESLMAEERAKVGIAKAVQAAVWKVLRP